MSEEPEFAPSVDGELTADTGYTPEETPSEVFPVAVSDAPIRSWWQRIFGQKSAVFNQRLAVLDATTAYYPQSPTAYVLRGELYQQMGEYELAAADYERALEYARVQLEDADWGLVAQAVQDQAEAGLAFVGRQLNWS